jgi:hypothetical protein
VVRQVGDGCEEVSRAGALDSVGVFAFGSDLRVEGAGITLVVVSLLSILGSDRAADCFARFAGRWG